MRMATKVTVLTIAVMALTFGAFADDATQTDWSGGDGVPGPVTDWVDDEFDTSTDISWLALPCELHLSSTPKTPVEHLVDDNFNGACFVYAADLDGDGDMDVLGAAVNADDIAWWANNGSGSGWTKTTIDADFDGVRSVYAADLDGDGDMDVLGAASSADDIVWWENDGSGGGWAETTIDANFNGANSVYAGNVNIFVYFRLIFLLGLFSNFDLSGSRLKI